jgi:hypothetical protein
MYTLKTSLIIIAGMLFMVSTGYTKPQYHIEQGACGVGSAVFAWWSVTSVDGDGRATEVWGVDCSGTSYHHTFTIRATPTDPTTGKLPNITGPGTSGNVYAIVTYHDPSVGNTLTTCAGRDSNGLFWEATIQ